jgi:hypothetical protein
MFSPHCHILISLLMCVLCQDSWWQCCRCEWRVWGESATRTTQMTTSMAPRRRTTHFFLLGLSSSHELLIFTCSALFNFYFAAAVGCLADSLIASTTICVHDLHDCCRYSSSLFPCRFPHLHLQIAPISQINIARELVTLLWQYLNHSKLFYLPTRPLFARQQQGTSNFWVAG